MSHNNQPSVSNHININNGQGEEGGSKSKAKILGVIECDYVTESGLQIFDAVDAAKNLFVCQLYMYVHMCIYIFMCVAIALMVITRVYVDRIFLVYLLHFYFCTFFS